MSIERHIEEVAEAAALYTLGKLPEAEMRGFEQRIAAGCPLCQAHLETCLQTAELMIEGAAVAPPPSLKDRLMRQIESAAAAAPAPAPAAKPAPAQMRILRAHEGEWTPSPAPGVDFRFLQGRRSLLVRMQAGASLPSHPHALDEHCLVIEGTVRDDEGTTLGVGDFLFMPKGSTHATIYSDTGGVFLIAYV
ncbi:MAG TPA: cupin domain-containing protein [Bryobacteraceae bacterium]|jgi:anti-sigma factor ChrR (cupin superfamily)